MELVSIQTSNGNTSKVMVVYDGGSQSTFRYKEISPYFLKKQALNYQLETLHGITVEKGQQDTIQVIGRNGTFFYIEGLIRELSMEREETNEIPIPHKWVEKFGLPEIWKVTQGLRVVVLGQDMAQYFPREIDWDVGLTPSVSDFTG